MATPAAISEARREELNEEFKELTHGAKDLSPITPQEHRARVAKLAGLLKEAKVDGFLVEPGSTFEYLTGKGWWLSERLFGIVVLADGNVLWVAPAFEGEIVRGLMAGTEDAPGLGGEFLGWDEHEYAYAPLAAALKKKGVERLAVEPRLRHFIAYELGELLGHDRIVYGAPLTQALRAAKDTHELQLMRRANELTQRAFEAVHERLKPGITARQISEMFTVAQERLGLTKVWNLSLIDANAAEPHGSTDDTPLEKGSLLLVDTGGSLYGYQSDNTRTWVIDGEVPDEVQKVWRVVQSAQQAAFRALEPGVPAKVVDQAARKVIADAGYGAGYETFTHRLGHGIGMDVHEPPYCDGGSEAILEPGMCFSNEPGIYLRGKFGVRLENIVSVTEDGGEVYGPWQESPLAPR
jgi:Xaa-Pro dipeptidase